jgi:maltose alpha-D-glucosyltransferase/alpha-amylase
VIDDLWYKNAIFYTLDVKTFMDANGDGVGDFEGLMRRLDYLAGLGITALWLTPFQPSPNRDDGYDISDYYGVDPRHGTLGDFVEFTQQARQRGIRVIIDLVINHTSDQHPWFQEARRDPNARTRDWYYWSKRKPRGADRGMVFPGEERTTWTWDREARAYYYHRFYSFQPDLDTQNPAVQEEIRKIMGFWLQLGVSGFRVDAVPFVIEQPDLRGRAPTMHFEYLRELNDFLRWRTGDGVLLGEANILPRDDMRFFGPQGDRMHMILNFQVNQHMFYAFATGDARDLGRTLTATRRRPETSQWGIFLRSHDELDLGRLTDEQRADAFRVFAPDEDMRLYDRGIRRRLASMLGGDQRRIELALSLCFSLPGTPVLRYGDEIGMGDDLSLRGRNSVRTPMQWTPDRHAGFSSADRTELPVIEDGPFGCRRVNVADQRRARDSLLNCTERLIRMRKECPELGWGDFRVLRTGSSSVLAIHHHWRGNALVTVHNFSPERCEVALTVPGAGDRPLTNLLVDDHGTPGADGHHRIALEPYGYRWYRVGAMLEVMQRRPQ